MYKLFCGMFNCNIASCEIGMKGALLYVLFQYSVCMTKQLRYYYRMNAMF
jgi:hypothetical protein